MLLLLLLAGNWVQRWCRSQSSSALWKPGCSFNFKTLYKCNQINLLGVHVGYEWNIQNTECVKNIESQLIWRMLNWAKLNFKLKHTVNYLAMVVFCRAHLGGKCGLVLQDRLYVMALPCSPGLQSVRSVVFFGRPEKKCHCSNRVSQNQKKKRGSTFLHCLTTDRL